MATTLPMPWSARVDGSRQFLLVVYGGFALSAMIAFLAPAWFWVPLAIIVFAAAGVLVFRHLVAFCVAWLLIAGATLEMTLADLIGPGAYQSTIAAVKTSELGLAFLCVIRYGFYADVFSPGLAFVAMYVQGLAHGLHPSLTPADSLRSLLGSVAPFAFSFSRLPPRWGGAIVRATVWVPLLSVAGGAALDLAGLRPVFVDTGGWRLAGLGHPAFLGGICLPAIYACLTELYRDGRGRWLALLGVNFLILVLTGARAPLACATAVTGLTLCFVHSDAFPRRRRILPLLVTACLLPVLAVLAHDLPMVRLFNILTAEAGNLSGRELLWPPFEQAAAASPWFGWGVGAGNAIIPPDSELARMIQSWAAHNEYLRLSVEGGELGRGLLIGMFALWVVVHTRRLCRTDRAIMRLAFFGFAAHAYTDNVLIATTACVFFTFATAVFVRSQPFGGSNTPPGCAPQRMADRAPLGPCGARKR